MAQFSKGESAKILRWDRIRLDFEYSNWLDMWSQADRKPIMTKKHSGPQSTRTLQRTEVYFSQALHGTLTAYHNMVDCNNSVTETSGQ